MHIIYSAAFDSYILAAVVESHWITVSCQASDLAAQFPFVPIEQAARAAENPGTWQAEEAVLR